MDILKEYNNGNTHVTIYEDGSKIRVFDGNEPLPEFPESIDIKITNFCDLECAYCHESSTTEGKHANLSELMEKLKELPAGVEFAIGGGNPLAHPDLRLFLEIAKERGFICNLTVNQGHLNMYKNDIEFLIENKLIWGLGISITSNNFNSIRKILRLTDNVVFHVIAGVNKPEILNKLIKFTDNCKVLVLGYKYFGFGEGYHDRSLMDNRVTNVDKGVQDWYRAIPAYIGSCSLSFDNLGIEQLGIKRLFTEKGWRAFYMGDDFQFTMYIDAVERTLSPTSRSKLKRRRSWKDYSIVDYFNKKP